MLKASDCTLLEIPFPMTRYMKAKATILSLLALTVILFPACTTTTETINPITREQQTELYQDCYLYATVDQDTSEIFPNAIIAVDEMGLLRTGEKHYEDHIIIYARAVGDKKIKVRITQIETGKSQIRIRVGVLGNFSEAQFIYSKIRDSL